MEDINKPDWLKAFEEDAKAFNESKFGKMTEKEFRKFEGRSKQRESLTKEILSKAGVDSIQKRMLDEDAWKDSLKPMQIAGGKTQGPIQGKKNSESGHIQELGRKNAKYNNRDQTCPHCGINSRGVGYVRWHGDNCKLNPNKTK